MKYLSWIVLGLSVLAGLTVSIYYAIQPKPIPQIKFSQFKEPAEMGQAIYHRLRLEIKNSSVIFLGVEPEKEDHMKIWNGFLEAANSEGVGYSKIVTDPFLTYKNNIKADAEIDVKTHLDSFYEGLQKAIAQNERLAIILPSIYISYLIPQSPLSQIFKKTQKKFSSFPLVWLPADHESEKLMDFPCVKDDADYSGTRELACMALNEARQTYRKKKDQNKHSGLMSRVGETEYLVLFR